MWRTILDTAGRTHSTSFIKVVTRQCLKQYSTRRFTKVRGLDVCRLYIAPHHKICHSAEAILKDPSHVLQPGLRQRYEPVMTGRYDELQEGLWLMFTSNSMQKKKVVRSWARRRMTQAVVEQLRSKGFDSMGKKIASGTTAEDSLSRPLSGDGGAEHIPNVLIGTVDLEVLSPCIEANYREVQRQAGLIVEEILKICGRFQRSKKSSTRLRIRNTLNR